jgi:hypothetical protein
MTRAYHIPPVVEWRHAAAFERFGQGDSGHGILNAGGHLPERSRPRKLPAGGHEICTPSR